MSLLTVEEGIELHYSDDGHGPVVLLLHGWACDGSDWSWLAVDLAADHRVIIPDHRGHGRSTPTTARFGAKVLAADAEALLERLSIEHAVVVGHSMGTLVASALAVERPDLVTALILIDPCMGKPVSESHPHSKRSGRIRRIPPPRSSLSSTSTTRHPGWRSGIVGDCLVLRRTSSPRPCAPYTKDLTRWACALSAKRIWRGGNVPCSWCTAAHHSTSRSGANPASRRRRPNRRLAGQWAFPSSRGT